MSGWYREAQKMPPPSEEEIAEWADRIVYGETPDGTEVYFNLETHSWQKVRRLGPNSEPSFETPAG